MGNLKKEWSFYGEAWFWKLNSAFNGNPIRNCLPCFFEIMEFFYQMFLSHTLGRGPNKSQIKKKSKVIGDKALSIDSSLLLF